MKQKDESFIRNIGVISNLYLLCLILRKLNVFNELNWIIFVLIRNKNLVVLYLFFFIIEYNYLLNYLGIKIQF